MENITISLVNVNDSSLGRLAWQFMNNEYHETISHKIFYWLTKSWLEQIKNALAQAKRLIDVTLCYGGRRAQGENINEKKIIFTIKMIFNLLEKDAYIIKTVLIY